MRNENQDQPAGSLRTLEHERVVQVSARLKTVDDFKQLIVASRTVRSCVWARWPT